MKMHLRVVRSKTLVHLCPANTKGVLLGKLYISITATSGPGSFTTLYFGGRTFLMCCRLQMKMFCNRFRKYCSLN